MARRRLTRRSLLVRSGALGVGLVVGGSARRQPSARAATTEPPAALSPCDLRTYAALAVTVSRARGIPHDTSVVRQRVDHLRRAYAQAPDRRHIYAVIAGLNTASAPRGFASLPPRRRLELLRVLQATPIQTSAQGVDFDALAKRQLAADAQALVLSPAGSGDYSAAAPTPL